MLWCIIDESSFFSRCFCTLFLKAWYTHIVETESWNLLADCVKILRFILEVYPWPGDTLRFDCLSYFSWLVEHRFYTSLPNCIWQAAQWTGKQWTAFICNKGQPTSVSPAANVVHILGLLQYPAIKDSLAHAKEEYSVVHPLTLSEYYWPAKCLAHSSGHSLSSSDASEQWKLVSFSFLQKGTKQMKILHVYISVTFSLRMEICNPAQRTTWNRVKAFLPW